MASKENIAEELNELYSSKEKKTKAKVPQSLQEKLEEKFGKGTVVKASSEKFIKVKEVTSTGSMTLDKATKIEGIPKGGLLTHILGFESTGKTTLSLHIIAQEQKKGNPCAFLDVEGSFDREYAQSIGVDLNMLYIVDQEMLLKGLSVKDRDMVSGQEWLDCIVKLLQLKEFGIIVLDSVATLAPLSEIQNGIAGGGQIARVGAMLSQAMRTVNSALTRTNTGLIFLNQYRVSPGKYGNPYVEVGGEALKYYAALKLELTKSLDKEDNEVYGINVKAKVTKSKVGIPYGIANYYIEFGKGIQRWKEIMEIAVDKGIIEKAGNTYSFDGSKLAVGWGATEEFLQDNPELLQEIENRLFADNTTKEENNHDSNQDTRHEDNMVSIGAEQGTISAVA